MHAFELVKILASREMTGRPYLEFLRAPSMSMGVYHLKAGHVDLQKPHAEDEVYYVVAGRAQFRAGNEVRTANAGTLIYVERLVDHCFSDVTEDLTALVFFAPAEGSTPAH